MSIRKIKGEEQLNALRGKVEPKEVEHVLNNIRELNDYVEIVERKIIEEKVEEAKKKLSCGEKAIVSINPILIHVPEWQRELDIKNCNKISSAFNPYKWELPKVLYINGKLYIVDGNHRTIAAIKADITSVQYEVLIGATESEAMDLFMTQGQDRSKMKPQDTYNAALQAKRPEYVKLKEICNKNHVAVKGDRNPIDNPIGILTPVLDGVKMAKSNPELLDKILNLIGRLKWNAGKTAKEGKAYSAKVIRNMVKLYAYYAEKETELENILLAKCKGSKYFNDNLSEKWQDSMFDYLNGIIEKNIDVLSIEKKTVVVKKQKTA